MIRYALVCEHEHGFEGWFGSSDDYEDQHGRGLLACPACASKAVRKQIMAPAVAGTKAHEGPPPEALQMMMQAAQAMRAHVEETFDYVGDAFAAEARAIHEGRSEERAIYGEATSLDVKKLMEDGVPIAALPPRLPAKKDVH